jgi:ABC-type dipeptide/oligopeptide/nickel transport system ATPase subunit
MSAQLAATEASLISLLTPLFPLLDAQLVAYLASLACENDPPPAKWKSGADALAVFQDLLESYEAVSNPKEAKEKCDELFKRMQDKGLIKGAPAPAAVKPPVAAAASPAPKPVAPISAAKSTPATSAAASAASVSASASASAASASPAAAAAPYVPPVPGSTCQARFSGDGLFYRAVVVSSKTIPVVRILVRFVEYGDLEEVAPSALKDVQPPPAGKEKVAKAKSPVDGSDDDTDSDTDSEEDEDVASKSSDAAKAARLLHNPVRIGELGPSRAAARAAESAALAAQADGGPGRELTHREIKQAKKRALKAERLAREQARAQTWNPDVHKTAVATSALPLYLQSQHLAKKAGTKDIALEDLTLLAPHNAELLVQTELRLVYGRRYGLVGRNGIGKSTLLRAMSTYSIPRFPTWIRICHVEQECVADRVSVLDTVINSDLERAALVKEEKEINERLKEIEAQTAAAKGSSSVASTEPPSPTASVASQISATSISSSAVSSASASSSSATAFGHLDHSACLDRLAVLYDRLTEIDSATASARAATILAGLQFSPEMQHMPTAALSGGWRMRVVSDWMKEMSDFFLSCSNG